MPPLEMKMLLTHSVQNAENEGFSVGSDGGAVTFMLSKLPCDSRQAFAQVSKGVISG